MVLSGFFMFPCYPWSLDFFFPPPLSEVRRLPLLWHRDIRSVFSRSPKFSALPFPHPSLPRGGWFGTSGPIWRKRRRGGSPKSDEEEEEEEEGRAKRRKNTYLHPSATAERLELGRPPGDSFDDSLYFALAGRPFAFKRYCLRRGRRSGTRRHVSR